MNFLVSDILPLGISSGQQTVADCIKEQLALADRVEIAVGYVSRTALMELDELVSAGRIPYICLTIGMYYIEGMPERSYHTAMQINRRWQEAGIGEIRIVKPFKYHGKIYLFYQGEQPAAAVIGSANLGVLKPEASNRRQYEAAVMLTDTEQLAEIAAHIALLNEPRCSDNIAAITDMPLVREMNTALSGVEIVAQLPPSNVEFYKSCRSIFSFVLLLKVPCAEERFMDDGKHYTKSNINVCYAAPRNKRKSRDWYETQLTVGADVYRREGYPAKNQPFFVITDDGYYFKAHTTSDNNKQFSAVGDELIMGRWLKGRLAAAGLVRPVNDTLRDTERTGMITQEMLREYGCNALIFKNTGQMALDEDGTALPVWFLSFERQADE